jgi:dipeptidyl aminopeptidase/acylaminoacyl peptidase
LEDRSRRAQKWVNEEFYKVLDVFGFRSVMFVEWGFRPADVRRTTERIKSPMAVVKQWVRTAEQEQKLAEEAEASGHRESAAEFYYRAALYYGPPCGVIHANTPKKLELYQRMVYCYTRFTELFDEAPVQRVEIPFENGKSIPGILQTMPGAKGKTPVVLVIPGMDTIKEYMPSPYHNHFRRRGMATLSIDGPGQGESNTRETWVTLDNFERAGKAALDFIETIPELDASKVGIYGWSMGSYWGPRVAAFDRRVKALVGAMGNYLQKDTIFKHSKPAYRANYMYMSNTYDEDAFDAMAAQMTLEPIAGKIKCPTLLAMGEYDELCPLADGERMFDLLTCPKELWVYEDETHVFGSRLPDFYLQVADWMRDALNGKFPAGYKNRIDHAAR